MTLWEELVATALLGTERRPPARPSVPANGDALTQALGGLPWDDAEGALLGAAAIVGGFRAAGWQPPVLDEAPSPAPHDERLLCSPGADAILARLLDSGPSLLLPEWLRLARAAGVRPAPEHLPALLDAGASASLRTAIVHAGGDRLRWLAAFDERWSWAQSGAAASAGIEERWQTGTRDERLELLRAVRTTDPEEGRALLESTWSADGAQDRVTLLAALAEGLEPADEAFLEAALDDRSKLVRKQAAELLAGLPLSAFAARMAQRLRPLVSFSGRLRRRLEVQAPAEPDAAAQRDGIDDAGRPQGENIGVGAWRLAQLVGAAPLSLWHELTGKDAAATYALASGADHEPALKLGWAQAARLQRDPAWSAVIARETNDPRLLEALPAGAADDVALALLGTTTNTLALTEILERVPEPLSAALSRAAIGHLVRTLALGENAWTAIPARFGLLLHVDARDSAAAAFEPLLARDDLRPAQQRSLADLLTILDLRTTMTRELTP